MPPSVLVTGAAGYIGSVLVRALIAHGYHVTGLDRLAFGGESIIDLLHHPSFSLRRCDLNDHAEVDRILAERPYDAVLHLAAIVGDPACAREPDEARRTNWEAGVHLVERCRARGIRRFVFASTCSNYGRMSDPSRHVDETSALAPVSLYAELKVKFERYLLSGDDRSPDFVPTALRFATVYGASPRMRFDLTVNEFTKDLAIGKGLRIYGQQFWRPYCHVRDFAQAYLRVLQAPEEQVAYDVFNVGDTSENYTKGMLIEHLLALFPQAKVEYVTQVEDPRDYRVNCDKIRDRLGFAITLRVPDGMREVADLIRLGIIREPGHARYYNIPYAG